MSASDKDEIEDTSDDQIIAVRRGEPVSVAYYLTKDEDRDGPPSRLIRE